MCGRAFETLLETEWNLKNYDEIIRRQEKYVNYQGATRQYVNRPVQYILVKNFSSVIKLHIIFLLVEKNKSYMADFTNLQIANVTMNYYSHIPIVYNSFEKI